LLFCALTDEALGSKAWPNSNATHIMKPPIVVFDLDGTLVDTAPDLVSSINHALGVHGHQLANYADIAPFAGTGGRGMLKHYCHLHGKIFKEAETSAIIKTFLSHYEAEIPGRSKVYDGAPELITALKFAGFKTAICTNKPQYLADKLLVQLKLADQFDAICGADYFTFRKPDPRHLTETIALAGGDQTSAIMFGDSQTDFDTANAAGIPVVGVTFGYSPEPIANFKMAKTIGHYSEINAAGVLNLITAK
jgi:phosphoglycolate phosphatase